MSYQATRNARSTRARSAQPAKEGPPPAAAPVAEVPVANDDGDTPPTSAIASAMAASRLTLQQCAKEGTVKQYRNRVGLISAFLVENGRPAVRSEDGALSRMPDVDTELLPFLESVQRGKKSKSLSMYRSALRGLAKLDRSPSNPLQDYDDESLAKISSYLKGVRNQNSEAVRRGEAVVAVEGARHLKVGEYERLCREALKHSPGDSATDLHCYLVLSWILCARLDTASSCHTRHLEWDVDCCR